jgi:1,2-phenylacetyl-CoA epoxidase catalytic subunit
LTLDEWFEKTKELLREQASKCAEEARDWAVKNHPWENVKGEAEKHLIGYVQDTGDKIGFGVAQGVEYGKWLEEAHDGKYGICRKAIDHFVPEFDAQIKDALKTRPS